MRYQNELKILQLEYTIDHNKGGYKQQYPDNNYFGGHSGRSNPKEDSSFLGSLVDLAACCLIIYGLYKTCIAPSEHTYQSRLALGSV